MAEKKNSKARIAANNRYNAKAYDRINLAVSKGNKEQLQTIAHSCGETVNEFVNKSLEQRIRREHPEADYNFKYTDNEKSEGQ